MSLADSALMELGYIEEVTWGVTPSTPELIALRLTGESLKKELQSAESNEISSTRDITDAIVLGGQAAGGVNFELSYGEYTTWFEHLLMETREAGQTITGTDLSLAGAQILSTADAFTAVKNVVDQWIKITGSVPSSNDGLYRISAFAIGALDLVDEFGITASFTADSANASLEYVSSDRIRNGVTKKSLTIEKGSTDVSAYQQFQGMRVQNMNLDFRSRDLVQGSFNFIGKGSTNGSSTIDNAGGYTASQVNSILNTADHMRRIWYDGVESTDLFKLATFTCDNGLRPQDALGSADLAGVGVGRFKPKGTLEAYFQNFTMYDDFVNNLYKNLLFMFDDDATSAIGNVMVFSFPRVKFLDAGIPAEAADSDIMVPLDWTGTRDPVNGYAMQIDLIAA